jgi:hypothetical protein
LSGNHVLASPEFLLVQVFYEIEGAGPSHVGIGALSRSISATQISKTFPLVLHNVATNELKPG